MNEVTQLLNAAEAGDPRAVEQLLPLVYDELRRLAAQKLSHEKAGQTLSATGLVHEAYLRLVPPASEGLGEAGNFANRRHFFAAAAEAMRRILVETARRKNREKHGGGRQRQARDLNEMPAAEPSEELLALNDALEAFARYDPQKAKLVELRYFGQLTLAEAAACLDISPSTADRAWRFARAWLHAAMSGEQTPNL